MKRRAMLAAAVMSILLAIVWAATQPRQTEAKPAPVFDASAAVIVAPDRIVVADDEQNILRVYGPDDSAAPLAQVDLGRAPGLSRKEIDIEGGALLDDRIFWIGSHGRSRTGVLRAERCALFSTAVSVRDGDVTVEPKGTVYRSLLDALLTDRRYRGIGLEEATRLDTKKAPELAPKRDGLNIEGLAPMPDGKGLYIGLRNPRPRGKALVIPLLNPFEVVDDGAAPQLGDPILLSLGGQGVRGMEWATALDTMLIIAGPPNDEGDFVLYRWSGNPKDDAAAVTQLEYESFTPETLVQSSEGQRVRVLSDDGWKKDAVIKDAAGQKHFTSVLLETATWKRAQR